MDERAKRVERFFDVPVLIAALLVLPVIVIEETAVSDAVKTVAAVLNWAIWLVFAAELIAMLWVIPDRSRWLIENPWDVAIVVLTPPLLPPGVQSLRALRLLRLVRLLKLVQISRRMFSRQGLRYAALLALLTLIGGGAAFIAAENNQHLDLWDGVWWAFGTMTPAGSNIEPETTLGRIIGIVVTAAGIVFIAFLTGAFAERFLAPEIQEEAEETREEIGHRHETINGDGEKALAQIRVIAESVEALESEVRRLAGSDGRVREEGSARRP
jgi:voltage-gated potassium channel